MTKPKGGRGHKATYETTIVRIPVDIKNEVEALADAFRSDELKETKEFPDFETAVETAQNILKSKKSAKISMEKLLKALYNRGIIL